MQIVRSREELTAARAALDGTVALVPTMGALHAGHLALVAEARALADQVIVSIFVNPTQFGPSEDFARYPRNEESDLTLLADAGCDLAWLPAVADLYPQGATASIRAGAVATRWEGEARPGHFDGVATVVARLFELTRPDVAIFGEKDFQQLAVIRHMVAERGLPVKIVGLATVRGNDGLALSSRNAYLSPNERRLALALPQALATARDGIRGGQPVTDALVAAKQKLIDSGFLKIDYLALVDAATMEPLDVPAGDMRLIVAAWMGGTRLIDNLAV